MTRDEWDTFGMLVAELKKDSAGIAENSEALKKMGDADRGRYCEGVAWGIKNATARFEHAIKLSLEPDAMPRPDLEPLVPKPEIPSAVCPWCEPGKSAPWYYLCEKHEAERKAL